MITQEEKVQMKTLSSLMNKLKEKGYEHDFRVKNDQLVIEGTDKTYNPDQVRIIDFYRFEGESDPSDNAILYAMELSTGETGILADAYGMYADDDTTEFLNKVQEMHKSRGDNSVKED